MKKFSIILYIILAGCANQTTPTGGPKDETPPKLISSSPKAETTNFKDNTIELNFNELIQLEKPKEQIIISPAVKNVEYTFRKNKVILTFKDKLSDSTTYNINFREAIKDLTEKNPAQNIKLAFSTGPIIDTLTIAGTVFNLLAGKVESNVTIALQEASDTFNLFKHKARIITKSDPKSGKFKFTNLKSGEYIIYAFLDKNNNLLIESQNESFAYQKNAIRLLTNKDSIQLPLINVDNRPLKVISLRAVQNYFAIKLNKCVRDVKIKSEKPELILTSFNNNAEFKLYNTNTTDSTLVNMIFKDSVNQIVDTTFYAKFNHQYDQKRLEKFKVNYDKTTVLTKSKTLKTKLSFNKPIININVDSIYIQIDSLSRETIKIENIKYDSINNSIDINQPIQYENNNTEKGKDKIKKSETLKPQLIFGKGSIISIDQDSSLLKKSDINFIKEEDLAKIFIEPIKENEFIQLLDQKGEVIQTIFEKNKTSFENVSPGEYKLRLIKDTNNNKIWDNAIPQNKQESEAVYYYLDDKLSQTFFVKANWDYGPLLIKQEYRVDEWGKDKEKKQETQQNR